jgi:hypothetical protein
MSNRSEAARNAAIDEMLDRAELYELAMKYGRAVDRCDRELLISLYHPDAVDNHGADFQGNPQQFADYVAKSASILEASCHYILNTSYVIEGDRANGELYFYAYHRRLPPESQEIVVCGRYLDVYERRNGAWKILKRELVWDWADNKPMSGPAMQLLKVLGEAAGKEDDMSYRVLPLWKRGR